MIKVNNGIMRLNGRWFNYTPPPPPIYYVYTHGTHGDVSSVPAYGTSGTEVTLNNTPASGYRFDNYSVTGATLKNANQFDIVNSDVYVEGNFSLIPPVYNVYTSGNHGVVVATPNSGLSGTEVTLTNTPASGYTFDSYSVTGATLKNSNQFDIANSDVYVYGNFKDPYNPLDLPPYTIRVRLKAGETPVVNYNYLPAEVFDLLQWTCVDETNNIWDMNFVYNDWGCNSGSTPDAGSLISRIYNGDTIVEILGFNSTGITSMIGLFHDFTQISSIPLFDTSSVTNMRGMFFNSSLREIPLYDTSNVTDMFEMFESSDIRTIPLLNTANVTNMTDMFTGCSNLTTIPLINTSNVTSMSAMFNECTNLTSVPLINTGNVTNMYKMFYHCEKLTTLPLLNTANVTKFESMLARCSTLTSIPYFNTSKATDMDYMCEYCYLVNDYSAYNLYLRAASQTNPPTYHNDTFLQCGRDTTNGAAALAQIPSSWK